MAEQVPQIPGYKIQKKMGQGGMATVYLAVQESFGRNVALKIMSSELGADDVWARRFIHEAKVVAQLSHPNIVPVFDVGTCEGRFYISMELLKGGMLEDKIAKGLSIPEVIKIIVGVAAGLDFAGEKGFVHRDIKPDNVMFREDGSPVILDFGIVKQMGGGSGDKMTQTGTIVGTTAYMSPEQAMGKELDQRSDIYSLGIMMYELLAGRVPFQGSSAVEVLMKHVQEAPAPLPDFVSIFQPVIDKALAKDREGRYGRALEMIEHIQELEPQIRQMLAQQKAAFAGGTNDATVAQAAVNATVQTKKLKTKTTKVVDEDDLTSVLSSAKATISNFSEESRVRRARNTKRAIAAAIIITFGALGYGAYQQFYLVPKAAELASKQRLEKIEQLLDSAQSAQERLKLTDADAANQVIGQYRDVLVLDSENKQAIQALANIGGQYIQLANLALQADSLSQADTYREYAEQLSPKDPNLPALREGIKALRAASTEQQLAEQFRQQQIETLFANANNNINVGNLFSPAENNAYDQLQQILKIDSAYQPAKEKVSLIVGQLFTETEQQIRSSRLREASANLDLLQRYSDNASRIASLQADYNSAKRKADAQANAARAEQKKEDLLSKATRLKRDQRTMALNDEIRDLYLSVLEMDSANADAKQGLEDTSRFLAEQASTAIKKRDYTRAAQYLNEIQKYTPDYAALGRLKTELADAKSASSKAEQLLSSAAQLIRTPKTGDSKRIDLAKAYSSIDGAKQLDPANPNVPVTLASLESEYVATITQLIAAQDRDLAEAYLADTANKNWPSERILKLQLTQQSVPEAEKPKPKRVMSGGF